MWVPATKVLQETTRGGATGGGEDARTERSTSAAGEAHAAVGVRAVPNSDQGRDASLQGGRQRVITEWELESYLATGWQYVATLPSGRIIVGAPATLPSRWVHARHWKPVPAETTETAYPKKV
jgi:hypothetical protein